MRKIFSLFVTLIAAIALNATVVTLNPSDFTAVTTAAAINQTVKGVTLNLTKGVVNDTQIRIYKGETITLTAESAISAIVFTCTAGGDAQYGPGCFAAQTGYSYEGTIGTWIAPSSATTASFTASSAQVRASKIEVYFDGETPGKITYDTLSIAQAVSVASALADNATSDKAYVIDGYAVNVYAYSTDYKNQDFFLVENAAQPDSVLKVFRATPTKDGKAYPVVEGDQVRLLGNLMKYVKDGKTQLEITNSTLTFLKEAPRDTTPTPPTPVVADTITVAQALEIGQALAEGAKTDKQYVIAGYSSSIETPFDSQYGNETFWMADTKESTAASNADGAFYVYRGTLTPAEEMGVHAKVFVTSVIMKYMKSGVAIIETNGKVNVNVVEKGVVEIPDTITVAKALEIGGGLASSGVSEKTYVIKGYVSDIQDYYSEQYGNETFWITDTKGDRTSDKTKAFEVYRGKPNTQKEIGLDALIQIKCKIKNYNGTIENDGVNLPFEVLEQGKPVVVDTVSVAEALEIGQALADNAYTDNPYVVIGYVTKAYEPDSGKTQQNFYMADDPDVRGDFYAYKASPDSKISQGDYVELFGKIQKYVGSKGTTIELSYGSAKHLEAPKVDTLTVAEVQALDLAEWATTEERYVVIGYVAAITSDFEEDLQSFTLSDDAAATVGEFICIDAVIAEPGAKQHDQVKITGKIQKMYGAFRMVSGKAAVLTPQGIENVVLTEKAQKVLVDGVIYIIRDNKIFNLQGTQVR